MHILGWPLGHILALLLLSATPVNASKNDAQKPIGGSSPLDHVSSRPNIILVLTDDQDLHLDSLSYTPLIRKHLIDRGTTYHRHYCTTAVCCPSRASLWTGKLAHNTNVTDLRPPYGGFPIFVKNGHNENYLPVWLQDAGYNTFYTGKMFNAHTIWNYHSPHLKGWTASDFLLDPYTYDYWNATFQRNKDAPVSHLGEYSTDVIASKAFGLLDEAVAGEKPFFLSIAPIGPHSHIPGDGLANRRPRIEKPQSADRHRHLFPEAQVPRTDNFNPEDASGANWVRQQPRLTEEQIEYNDEFYRGRLQSLQAVDEMVDGLFERLEHHGILDNTYVFYTSDNGFHIGQHRLQPGKETGYEEDIHVPLIIRGPGIAEDETSALVTAHIDLAPTFLSLAGAPLPPDLDGEPILSLSHLEDSTAATTALTKREHVNVEYWGWVMSEGKWGFNGGADRKIFNTTYKALRVVSDEYDLYYSVWCTNEHELYDMTTDPGQLRNLLHPDEHKEHYILGYALDKVVSRLDSLLLVLKSCKGSTCSRPWASLHPKGNIASLRDALEPGFDRFYDEQTKVRYSHCELGYLIEAEGPQFEEDGLVYWEGTSWTDWS